MEAELETSRLSVNQLVEPSVRCFVLVLVLLVSTGPLIRELFAVAILDLAALLVGFLWFLGDLVPSLSLVVLLHDAILVRKRDKSLDALITLFLALYLLDLVLFLFYTDSARLKHYRLAFFHLQIWLAMAYVFARTTRYDLRLIGLKFKPLLELMSRSVKGLQYRTPSLSLPSEPLERLPQRAVNLVEPKRASKQTQAFDLIQDPRKAVKTTNTSTSRKRKPTRSASRRRTTTTTTTTNTKRSRANKRRRTYEHLPVVNITVSSESRNSIAAQSRR